MICDSWLKSVQCCDYIFFVCHLRISPTNTSLRQQEKKKWANTWFLTNDKVIVPNLSYIYAPLFDPYWLDQMQQMCKRYGSELFLVIYIVYKLLNCKMKIFLGLSNGRKGGQSPRKKKEIKMQPLTFLFSPYVKNRNHKKKVSLLLSIWWWLRKEKWIYRTWRQL